MPPHATWQRWCSKEGFALDGDRVTVTFRSGRAHRVLVREEARAFVFEAAVVGAERGRRIQDLALRVWRWNRAAQRVGFYVEESGRVRAEGWVPREAGVTPEEFRDALYHVAAEADRLEHLLTGQDRL